MVDGLSTIMTQGFAGTLANLASNYISKKSKHLSSNEQTIITDFTDHLNNTFEKCMYVKTILSTNSPSKTLEIYTNQRFRFNNIEMDQFDLIDKIKLGGAYVIAGTGGGGKSMFMRYLWLSLFEDSRGSIPFFLELRNLNSFTHKRFEDFIFHSIIKSGSTISQSNFNNSLKSGEIILFLDGFDEINFDRRDEFERMILDMQENNPKLTIVVTGRPDDRFDGWTQFRIVDVLPLNEMQIAELIDKAPYDASLKKKFLLQIRSTYASQKEFLSTPLLAYMMLVTFSYNPDIPKKKFAFYEQAFEALYHRHDIIKGYRRQFHCPMGKQEFLRLISFLCLKTYHDEQYEFSIDELLDQVNMVKKIENFTVDSELFIRDLIESICLLKKEGLTYTFTHRSFQEYFAAFCISRVAIRNVDAMFTKFANRYGDSVLAMVYDTNADLFREKYIYPNYKKHQRFFDKKTARNICEDFGHKTLSNFEVVFDASRFTKATKNKSKRRNFICVLHQTGELAPFYRNMMKVRHLDRNSDFESRSERRLKDEAFVDWVHQKIGKPSSFICNIHMNSKNITATIQTKDKPELSEDYSVEISEKFKNSGMYEYSKIQADKFKKVVLEEMLHYNNVSNSFEAYFQ